MSTSQLTSKTTPLTSASHLPHPSYLQRYHALPSTSLITHYLIIADLEIKPFVRPPPPTHSFRLTGSIDRQAFNKDILVSQLILNPPSSLEDLLSCYNSTLSDLL